MKPYRKVRCLSRVPLNDKPKWIYTSKEFVAVVSEYSLGLCQHRVPWFLSIHAHLKIEEALEFIANLLLLPFSNKKLFLIYDVIHGLLCSYNMREIFNFWRTR